MPKKTFTISNCVICGKPHSNLDIEKFELTDDGLIISIIAPCKNLLVDITYFGVYSYEVFIEK